jgi:hypothetical protein
MAKICQLIENMASNVNGMSANENISAMKIICNESYINVIMKSNEING